LLLFIQNLTKKILRKLRKKNYTSQKKKINQEKKTLKQDSCLGYMLNLSKINLSRLIRGRHFILLYIISKNRYRITFIIFVDSRTNGFAFINTSYIIDITKFLNLKT
jgi:hypothetical protein